MGAYVMENEPTTIEVQFHDGVLTCTGVLGDRVPEAAAMRGASLVEAARDVLITVLCEGMIQHVDGSSEIVSPGVYLVSDAGLFKQC